MALPSRPPSSTSSRSPPPPPASGGGGGEALRRCNCCCHCRRSRTSPLSSPGHLSLTVLVMPCAFLHTKTGDCCQRLRHRTEGDRSANLRLGKLLPGSPEDLRFRAFFGVSAQVSVTAWDMMENHSVLPPTPEFLHFLWALAFMRTYPANDTTLSSLLGGRDPKTMSKYMWPFIRSIFALNEWLVSW